MTKAYIKIIFVIYLLLGVYLANIAFEFFPMPSFMASIESWVFLIAGVLLIFAGFGFLKRYKHVA